MKNKWDLYNWLKQSYLNNLCIASVDASRAEFPDLSLDEIEEGYVELAFTIKRLNQSLGKSNEKYN